MNSLFLKSCRREPGDRTPVWLMRQAGRYMQEYRMVREKHGFLDLCKNPDLATEVTVFAAERLGVDAAILFSDILLILEPMGIRLEYSKGDGPVIHNPVRTAQDVVNLQAAEPSRLDFVYQAVRQIRQSLPSNLPLIGFSGAPFTLASYLIEGGSSRKFIRTRGFMRAEPSAWRDLLQKLSKGLSGYLNQQIASGADAVQIFDSWVGCLTPAEYRAHVLPHVQSLIRSLKPGVPVIHFGTKTAPLLELMKEAGGDVIGVDHGIELDEAWQRLGCVAVQGNLDPKFLLEDIPTIRREAQRILDLVAGRPGHIFNLGHGVLPQTPVDHAKALVDFVHEYSSRISPHPASGHPLPKGEGRPFCPPSPSVRGPADRFSHDRPQALASGRRGQGEGAPG